MERFTRRTSLLVAVTGLAALPALVLGARSLLDDGPNGLALTAGLTVAIAVLCARPIRPGLLSQVNLATVPLLGGALVLPATSVSSVRSRCRASTRVALLDSTRIDLAGGRTIPMPERSWGVAAFPLDGTTARELVVNADTRAYARKRAKA